MRRNLSRLPRRALKLKPTGSEVKIGATSGGGVQSAADDAMHAGDNAYEQVSEIVDAVEY